MEEMVELRCKYCGAPLDKKDLESESPYVTCQCCGTSQQRVDAKAYMDQMMGEIKSWISKAVPGGFSISQTENVDPIARHSIYVNNVKPMIDPEIREFKLNMNIGLLFGIKVDNRLAELIAEMKCLCYWYPAVITFIFKSLNE